jgi:hypothetical protein
VTRTVEVEMDDEREAAFAGLMILEAVDDEQAWRMFWQAVTLARHRHHKTGPTRQGAG